jgi:hypothetical protein
MIDGLAAIDGVFGRWCKFDETGQTLFCEMPANRTELTQFFDRNRVHRDSPREAWPERGFSFGSWNGLSQPHQAGMFLNCGVYVDGGRVPNVVKIELSKHSATKNVMWTASELKPALNVMIEAWDAQEAAVLSNRYTAISPMRPPEKPNWPEVPWRPLVGWITFVPKARTAQIGSLAGVDVDQTAGGNIYSLCEEPFSTDNPDHLARAAAMEEALRPIRY